jgi:hypothetical protein
MALDYSVIKKMRKFTSLALADEFFEQYKYEYGEKKAVEIAHTVEDSEKVQNYLQSILIQDIKPSAKGLWTLMNTISYFMFSKEETVCLGGLSCFVLWRNKWLSQNGIFDSIEQVEFDKAHVEICIELIDNCSTYKYNKFNNFFYRFQSRIVQICWKEGIE